jgi:hypothetical protein
MLELWWSKEEYQLRPNEMQFLVVSGQTNGIWRSALNTEKAVISNNIREPHASRAQVARANG